MTDDFYDDDDYSDNDDYSDGCSDLCDQFEKGLEPDSEESVVFKDEDRLSPLGVTDFAMALGLAEAIADENAVEYIPGAEFVGDDDEEIHRKAELISLHAEGIDLPQFEQHVVSRLNK